MNASLTTKLPSQTHPCQLSVCPDSYRQYMDVPCPLFNTCGSLHCSTSCIFPLAVFDISAFQHTMRFFFHLTAKYSILWTHHHLPLSSTDGHWSCFCTHCTYDRGYRCRINSHNKCTGSRVCVCTFLGLVELPELTSFFCQLGVAEKGGAFQQTTGADENHCAGCIAG